MRARRGASGAGEVLFGLTVVRDELGPASSLNIAHGMVKSGTEGGILAVTDAEAFLHSGLPAFVNTLYNGSAYLLLIKTKEINRPVVERVDEGGQARMKKGFLVGNGEYSSLRPRFHHAVRDVDGRSRSQLIPHHGKAEEDLAGFRCTRSAGNRRFGADV